MALARWRQIALPSRQVSVVRSSPLIRWISQTQPAPAVPPRRAPPAPVRSAPSRNPIALRPQTGSSPWKEEERTVARAYGALRLQGFPPHGHQESGQGPSGASSQVLSGRPWPFRKSNARLSGAERSEASAAKRHRPLEPMVGLHYSNNTSRSVSHGTCLRTIADFRESDGARAAPSRAFCTLARGTPAASMSQRSIFTCTMWL